MTACEHCVPDFGGALHNAPTGTLQDTREFEFARFRFDYILRKVAPEQNYGK